MTSDDSTSREELGWGVNVWGSGGRGASGGVAVSQHFTAGQAGGSSSYMGLIIVGRYTWLIIVGRRGGRSSTPCTDFFGNYLYRFVVVVAMSPFRRSSWTKLAPVCTSWTEVVTSDA